MTNNEILYLYDAKLTNPNGDPDEENRPRMDYQRDMNLVSDLRLKRYIRDYLTYKGHDIFVRRVDDKPVTADKRIKDLKDSSEDWILENLTDVRMFGATMTVKKDNKTFIGPIQFNWGYSLNKVELLEASITSHFSANEKATQGTMGKDFRVKYSLIAFSGVVSGKRAEKTRLKEEDLYLLDEAMRHAIPNLATRSKIGQYPRLYMRVEYNDSETILGDYRDYIKLEEKVQNIRDINECYLAVDELVNLLDGNKEKIKNIYYYADKNLQLVLNKEEVSFEEAFENLPLTLVE
ncbi:type I-B CRISPR-associated protein Cas7/Csh2 [Sporanaerobacter acetigenes]|uniref:CRISPR-associated protein, Csh2 family n=1 Tax=Sporanaerobacter acetigenes DSM 13106 TaxID=1123281 RepID=A0A1M5YYR9_9FIRM|nr:type I-B CRISPR-associated protein Cas7/Csh2 [Sporanaerobacter acetigenes]SHI17179.1 CRISPR-associated protein, Csh2 family [Sporanaerobacter acetigenes DSM 13106]